MEYDAWDEPSGQGAFAQPVPRVEAAMLSAWRRVIDEGGSPELTLSEAAAPLDSSAAGVRHRIRAGRIRAYMDGKGLIRVNASVTYAPEVEVLAEDAMPASEAVAKLWHELKDVREQLAEARRANLALREELEAAEAGLEYTKGEVANLWAVMTSRRQARREEHATPTSRLSVERERIQSKIANMRDLAKRRRFPWSMAG